MARGPVIAADREAGQAGGRGTGWAPRPKRPAPGRPAARGGSVRPVAGGALRAGQARAPQSAGARRTARSGREAARSARCRRRWPEPAGQGTRSVSSRPGGRGHGCGPVRRPISAGAGHGNKRSVLTGHIHETAVVALECNGHGGGRAIPVLGHYKVCLPRPRRFLLISILAMQKNNDVGVLLDAAGFA
jgi:hypothetical protein